MKSALRFLALSFIFWMILCYFAGIIRFWFLNATPGSNWNEEARKADVAVAMGFGIISDEKDSLRSGRANDSLYKWMSQNTSPEVIIAQEGILLARNSAACREAVQKLRRIRQIRMHEHGKRYINTLEAARYALAKAETLLTEKDLKIVIVCHPDQMKRCYFDLTRVAKTKTGWMNYSFIVPDIPPIPYERGSSQIHTTNRFLFKTSDLLISRPRDFISLVFIRFAWIILPVCIILIGIYGIYRFLYRRKERLIAPEDEDRVLSLFILSNTGFWFLLVGIAVIMDWHQVAGFRFTVWIGLLIGLITGFRGFIFWNRTSIYEKKTALGEPVGAMGMGCFILAGNMMLGTITGILL